MVHYIYKGEEDEQAPNNTTNLSFGPRVTIIHHNAFRGCSSLTSLPPFPSTLTSIGETAFYNCSSLTSLPPFPSSLTFVGINTFDLCSNLKNIVQINADIVVINKRDGSWKAECQKRLALENQIICKLCISRIHSNEAASIRIRNTSVNDLSAGDFVFMVVDMMKNSGWYGQADRILEFVGMNVGLKTVDSVKAVMEDINRNVDGDEDEMVVSGENVKEVDEVEVNVTHCSLPPSVTSTATAITTTTTTTIFPNQAETAKRKRNE